MASAEDGSAGYGEVRGGVFTKESAPKDVAYKWDFLFGNMAESERKAIQMDQVCFFSITDHRTADRISDILLALKDVQAGAKVLDGTACGGGNTISFARKGLEVTAIELNEERFAILEHNVKLCGVQNRVSTRQGDLLKLHDELQDHFQVIFLDPPWGGVEYMKQERVSLFLSDLHLAQVCHLLRRKTDHFALKVPDNFDVEEFKTRLRELNEQDRANTKESAADASAAAAAKTETREKTNRGEVSKEEAVNDTEEDAKEDAINGTEEEAKEDSVKDTEEQAKEDEPKDTSSADPQESRDAKDEKCEQPPKEQTRTIPSSSSSDAPDFSLHLQEPVHQLRKMKLLIVDVGEARKQPSTAQPYNRPAYRPDDRNRRGGRQNDWNRKRQYDHRDNYDSRDNKRPRQYDRNDNYDNRRPRRYDRNDEYNSRNQSDRSRRYGRDDDYDRNRSRPRHEDSSRRGEDRSHREYDRHGSSRGSDRREDRRGGLTRPRSDRDDDRGESRRDGWKRPRRD